MTCVQANAPSMISILADGSYQLFYPARGVDGKAITSSQTKTCCFPETDLIP